MSRNIVATRRTLICEIVLYPLWTAQLKHIFSTFIIRHRNQTVCGTEKSAWLCLHCGAVHCGRYVAGHAIQHHEQNTQHCVCIDCENLAVFW